MYNHILVPLDNSSYSNSAAKIGIRLAKGLGSTITCSHVYAARLHYDRFQQMESGLPPKYQEEEELKKQRAVHDDLITKGLEIISDSYLDFIEKRCKEAGVHCNRKAMEGKNYAEIVKDVESGGYDLVIMGALGIGVVDKSLIGSVCERVLRRIRKDMMIARNGDGLDGRFLVAVDGSPNSFAGLISAIALAKVTGAAIEAVSVFDPDFHYTAFKSIAGVLSEEAGQIFKFKEQEKLHEDIIDHGLAKIYQDHLNTAFKMAGEEGANIKTTLLQGKPYDQILKYIEKDRPSLLVMGRTGVHAAPGLDIGSNTENCVRSAPCNTLVVSGEVQPRPGKGRNDIPWSEDAMQLMGKIPPFAQGVVRRMVEDYALNNGYAKITAEVMREARKGMQ